MGGIQLYSSPVGQSKAPSLCPWRQLGLGYSIGANYKAGLSFQRCRVFGDFMFVLTLYAFMDD